MSITTRLFMSFGVIIILLLAVAGQSNIAMRNTDNIHRININYILQRRELIHRAQGKFVEFRLLLRTSFHSATWREDATRHDERTYARNIEIAYINLLAHTHEYLDLVMRDQLVTPERREMAIGYMTQAQDYISAIYNQFFYHFFPGSVLPEDYGNVEEYIARVHMILDFLVELTTLSAEEALEQSDDIIQNSMNFAVVVVVFALAMTAALSYWMISSFTGRVRGVESRLQQLQEGEINLESKTDDEFSRLFTDVTNVFKLREQENIKRTQLMFDSTPIIIEFWDKNGKCLDCNRATLEFHGAQSKEDFLEKFDNIAYVPDSATGKNPWDGWHKLLSEAFESGEARSFFSNYQRDDTLAHYNCLAQRILTDTGEPIVVTYTMDVTAEKEIEAEREKSALAIENSLAKSRFLARMSHEIRTPLTAVLGISEIQLQNPTISLVVEEAFAKIHNSASVLLGLVNDILDLSRIESGKMDIINKEYEVASIVTDVVQMHMIYLGSKKIEFRVDTDENLPAHLIGDELRIRQVLNNLLSNAFKYTEKGMVELSLQRVKHADPDKITLKIRIRDTGLGMKPEHIQFLTQEYTRFHEREMRYVEGTGLGMPIVYSLLQMMGGTLEIESEVGVGTSVLILLPQEVANEDIIGAEVAANLMSVDNLSGSIVKRVKFVPESMPYGRVLVVDDIDTNLYVARGLLLFYDLQVDTCVSGREAIERIKDGEVYDLIFMDQMMPDMNGTQVTAIIREMGYTHPIIALTANALIGQAEVFLQNGFDGFLSKPIQTVHLNGLLTKFIRDKQPPEVIEAALSGRKKSSVAESIDSFLDREMVRLKNDFYSGQKNTAKNIRDELAAGNFESANRLAHTLKGLAGLIKEAELSKLAYEVEKIIRRAKVPGKELDLMEAKLTTVLAEIEGTIEAEPQAITNLPPEEATALLNNLQNLLEESDAMCLALTEELAKIPESKILIKLIEDCNFESAVSVLKIMREILQL